MILFVNLFNVKYNCIWITFVKLQNSAVIYICKLSGVASVCYKCELQKIASKRLSPPPTTWRSRIQKKSLSGDFLTLNYYLLTFN